MQCIHSSAVAFVTVHGDVNGDGDGMEMEMGWRSAARWERSTTFQTIGRLSLFPAGLGSWQLEALEFFSLLSVNTYLPLPSFGHVFAYRMGKTRSREIPPTNV